MKSSLRTKLQIQSVEVLEMEGICVRYEKGGIPGVDSPNKLWK